MDYQYITQDIVDQGILNITSGAMDAEAQKYNARMQKLHRTRQNVDLCFLNWNVIHVFLIFYCTFWVTIENETSLLLAARKAAIIPYLFLFFYFVIYRKKRDPKLVGLISLVLPLVAFRLIFLTIANTVLAHFYTKFQTMLESELGYPSFTQLKLTYLNENSRLFERD